MESNNQCLNCRSVIRRADVYCYKCGQKNIPPVLPVKEFFHNFLEDYFTFDSKVFRSTVWLMTRPGYLTKQYIEGRRANYIPPVRVLLFISVFFFLYEGCSSNESVGSSLKNEPVSEDTSVTDVGLVRLEGSSFDGFMGVCDPASVKTDSARKAFLSQDPDEFIARCHPDANRISKIAYSKVFKLAASNGNSFGELLFNASSKVIFLLVPLFALLLKLFYFRRKRYYFEHFVFSLHFHAFLFLSMLILSITGDIISEAWSDLIWFLFVPGILLYYVLALKYVYRQSGFKTSLKAILSLSLYLILFVPLGAFLTMVYAFINY